MTIGGCRVNRLVAGRNRRAPRISEKQLILVPNVQKNLSFFFSALQWAGVGMTASPGI
jgi:hypothetical protein